MAEAVDTFFFLSLILIMRIKLYHIWLLAEEIYIIYLKLDEKK